MTAASAPHPLDVRATVRRHAPHASEHLDGTTFDLPDGALLHRNAEGAWLLTNGATTLQIRTLPQLDAALRERLVVLPAPVLDVLSQGVSQPEPLTSTTFDDASWRRALADAARLGLVEPAAPSGWHLTERGHRAASAVARSAHLLVFAL